MPWCFFDSFFLFVREYPLPLEKDKAAEANLVVVTGTCRDIAGNDTGRVVNVEIEGLREKK